MRPLFEITQDMAKLTAAVEHDGMATTDTDWADLMFAEWAKELESQESVKLDGYIRLIKHLEMEEVAAKAETEQWAAKHKARRRQIEWLKSKMKRHMELTGREKIVTDKGQTISLQKNGGDPAVAYDQDALQKMTEEERAQFVDEVPVVNKTKVKEALEKGEVLTFARVGEPGTHLRIR